MIRAVTDLRTGERISYEIRRVGRTDRGRIASNERLRGFYYNYNEHPMMTLVRIYATALGKVAQ